MLAVKYIVIVYGNFNMTENDIIKLCKQYKIKNYTINSDMSVDVDDHVTLFNKILTTIPLSFGKVAGYFDCSNNHLISLKGCPYFVDGGFDCSHNLLTSLKDCPSYVAGGFWCDDNKLKVLDHYPSYAEIFYSYANNFEKRQFICDMDVKRFRTNILWKF